MSIQNVFYFLKMISILCFVCQKNSASVEIDQYTNLLTLLTQPNPDLKDQEIVSCNAQNGQTSLYTVTIGPNVFRSPLIIYNAFQDAKIILTPVDGATIEDALKFYIASYEITFLDSTLTQQGAIGQLLSTMYNLNECIYNGEVSYDTFTSITPKVIVNPNCLIKPTGDVNCEFIVDSNKFNIESIKQADFDFSNFVLKEINCAVGTDEQKENCNLTSIYISSSNFIYSEIRILIPRSITSNNIYTDDYGKEQNSSTTTNFILSFNISITKRNNIENCAKLSNVAFTDISVFIFQLSTGLCDFTGIPKQEFWLTASELSDNSGRKFQLQFYTEQPFNINQYFDCETWEISEYESKKQCEISLKNVSTYQPNFTSSISYKRFNSNYEYVGAFRFNTDNLPSGNAEISLYKHQLCVHLLKNLTETRTFASISIKLSSSFKKYQTNEINFEISNNFVFPESNQTYCFAINSQQEDVLNMLGRQEVFGIIQAVNNILLVNEIQSFIPYENFYQGCIFLVGMLIVMIIWVKATTRCKNERSKLNSHCIQE